MILRGATVYDDRFEPVQQDVRIEGERIAQMGTITACDEEEMRLDGCTIVPGLVEIHVHGCGGADMEDASASSLDTMSAYLASRGVTAFCPTGMTLPHEALAKQFAAAAQCRGRESGARILGVRMEGPYLSMAKKGAQCGDYIRPADVAEFRALHSVCPIRIVDVAPETEGAMDFAAAVCGECTVSIAHTAADFDTAQTALRSGFSHATHLFNAMPPILNRAPGPVTAVFDNDTATAEMICDGFHNHPAVVRMAFRLLGEDRIAVVSDAMRAAGCADGTFILGGQTVFVRNGQARLQDGTIAASTTNLFDEFCNLLRWGIPFRTALKACTITPARIARADGELGSVACGKYADLLVLDARMAIRAVFVHGRLVSDAADYFSKNYSIPSETVL